MSEERLIPANQEHFEAYQSQIDKERYEFVSKLPPEQQKAHAELEKAVAILNGSGCVFSVVAALPGEEIKYWHYHKLTYAELPYPKEERGKIKRRAWGLLATLTRFFCKITDHHVAFYSDSKTPYYVILPNKEFEVESNQNPDAIV